MLHVCVFFVISMDMLLFSFIIIEKVYLKYDVVLSLYMRRIMKTSSNLAASAATNVKIANKTAPSLNHIKSPHPITVYFFIITQLITKFPLGV